MSGPEISSSKMCLSNGAKSTAMNRNIVDNISAFIEEKLKKHKPLEKINCNGTPKLIGKHFPKPNSWLKSLNLIVYESCDFIKFIQSYAKKIEKQIWSGILAPEIYCISFGADKKENIEHSNK